MFGRWLSTRSICTTITTCSDAIGSFHPDRGKDAEVKFGLCALVMSHRIENRDNYCKNNLNENEKAAGGLADRSVGIARGAGAAGPHAC